MTSVEEHKKTAKMFIDFVSDGNIEGFLNLYHEDGAAWTSGNTLISGTSSKAEIQAAASQIFEAFPKGLQFKIHSMTAEGDRVAVEAESEGLHASGKTYRNHYHFLFIFKAGKILLLKEYLDTELVTEILCGGMRPQTS